MAFGLWSNREEPSEERRSGNRPDCAYFLLLGLCGAAFLLTIGGILTYIAFNPGSVDSRPHSPLSHIPHFHHHRKHHDRTEGHYFGHPEQHNYHHDESKQQHSQHSHQQQSQHSNNITNSGPSNISSSSNSHGAVEELVPTTTLSTIQKNGTSNGNETVAISDGENGTTPGSHLTTAHLSDKENKNPSSKQNHSNQQEHLGLSPSGNNSSHRYHHPLLESTATHHSNQQQQHQHNGHPGLSSTATHRHHEGNNTHVNGELQAKESLALAIIGGLCLTCGVLVTIIVGVFALKYDCDHEPEPNIAFLRLRSEMSLNFDQSKNNYELLMPASSSTTAGVGSTHSIHPGGMPRC